MVGVIYILKLYKGSFKKLKKSIWQACRFFCVCVFFFFFLMLPLCDFSEVRAFKKQEVTTYALFSVGCGVCFMLLLKHGDFRLKGRQRL